MHERIRSAPIVAGVIATAMAFGLAAPVAAQDDVVKVGVLATLEGTYTVLGEDGIRGIKTALAEASDMAGGKKIELIIASTDTTPDSAVRGARKLVEQDKVDIVLGPLSGSEGIAIRDYSKTQPQVTFINGISGALETTYVDPSENFFRFNMDGAQWSAGLGDYVFNEKGYEYVATVGEDYSFVYTQVLGFALEYCAAGGEITERLWVPLGTKDFASIIASLPDDVDAIYLGLGGGDAVNFLNQYQQAGGEAALIGGTIMVDGTVLNSKGKAKEALIGVPSSGPQVDTSDDPKWVAYVEKYREVNGAAAFPIPSVFSTGYYNATTAMVQGLNEVDGDLSDEQAKFREALANMTLDAPNGKITLDENRQAIGTSFVSEVVQLDDGSLATKEVSKKEGTNQTLGLDKATFDAIGLPGRDVPECKTSY